MTSTDQKDNRDPMVSSLYKDGDRPEPPAHFDDDILAAARREVRAGPRRSKLPGFSPWLIPISTAAVLVLSVSVVTLMRIEQPEQFEPERLAINTQPPSEDDAPARSMERGDAVKIKPLATQDALELGQSAPASAPMVKREEERKKRMADEESPDAALNEAAKQIEEDLRRKVEIEQARKRVEEERRRQEFQARAQAEMARRSQTEELRKQQAAKAAAERESASREIASRSAMSNSVESPAAAGVSPIQSHVPQSEAVDLARDIAPPLPQKVFNTPEEWLEEIARLRHTGEKELADDQLRLFKERYPDWRDEHIEKAISEYLTRLEKTSPP